MTLGWDLYGDLEKCYYRRMEIVIMTRKQVVMGTIKML